MFDTHKAQWCELHQGPAADVRAVRIGCHIDERYTVMICTECMRELVSHLKWAECTDTFKWDYIVPDVEQYEMLVSFVRYANAQN